MCLAVRGKIVSVTGDDPMMRLGKVNFGGIIKEINLAYTPEANIGDYVVAHVGFALSIVDEVEALFKNASTQKLIARLYGATEANLSWRLQRNHLKQVQ